MRGGTHSYQVRIVGHKKTKKKKEHRKGNKENVCEIIGRLMGMKSRWIKGNNGERNVKKNTQNNLVLCSIARRYKKKAII